MNLGKQNEENKNAIWDRIHHKVKVVGKNVIFQCYKQHCFVTWCIFCNLEQDIPEGKHAKHPVCVITCHCECVLLVDQLLHLGVFTQCKVCSCKLLTDETNRPNKCMR